MTTLLHLIVPPFSQLQLYLTALRICMHVSDIAVSCVAGKEEAQGSIGGERTIHLSIIVKKED